MHRRAVRVSLLVLLLAAAVAAAFLVADAQSRIEALEAERMALEGVIDRILPSVAGVAAAQQAYADDGDRDEASFTRVSALLDRITTDAASLRPSPRSDSRAHLEEFWAALSAVKAADAGARAKLAAGETLAAADQLFSSARADVAAMDAGPRAFRAAEVDGYRAARATLDERGWTILGAVAVLWIGGLVALVRVPAPHRDAPLPHAEETGAPPPPVAEPPTAVAPMAPSVDLAATADLCATIARLTDAASLPKILDRAAAILDARGIIIWMGAGDELFATTAIGYDAAVVSRLRPIGRRAENATAAAWRTGETQVVAGDRQSLGAIVAPMLGAGGPIGVLAAEVRNGRESDPATRAVTAIVASQLAGVLSAWPGVSEAGVTPPDAGDGGPPAERGSNRQAAAS